MLYVGIGKNRGKLLENAADALAYALAVHGVEPVGSLMEISAEFRTMLLEWEFSGDWVRYRDWEEYREEQGKERQRPL